MIDRVSFVKLINPRGRVIEVMDSQVEGLLKKGFSLAPNQTHEYNPVFDRGDDKKKNTTVVVGGVEERKDVFREELDGEWV